MLVLAIADRLLEAIGLVWVIVFTVRTTLRLTRRRAAPPKPRAVNLNRGEMPWSTVPWRTP